jgi:thymidylate kinase
LQKQKEFKEKNGHDQTIFFADRSPFSAVFYAKGPEGKFFIIFVYFFFHLLFLLGKLLEPLIQAQLKQLHALAGITIITVYVKVEPEVLWNRIQQRLVEEPYREKFNESSREWMDKTVNFYEDNDKLWDFTVENNSSIDQLVDKVVARLSHHQPRFSSIACKIAPEIARPHSPSPEILQTMDFDSPQKKVIE